MTSNIKLNILILLGGEGSRFSNEGYLRPKPLITIHGIPMIIKLINSLDIHPDDTLCIAYHDRLNKWHFEQVIAQKLESAAYRPRYVCIPFSSRGATETAIFSASRAFDRPENPLVIIDGDSIHPENVLQKMRDFYTASNGADAIVFQKLENPAPHFSFVKFLSVPPVSPTPMTGAAVVPSLPNNLPSPRSHSQDAMLDGKWNRIVQIEEKEIISHNICVGIYTFHSVSHFLACARNTIDLGRNAKGEFYISSVYQHILSEKVQVYGIEIGTYHSVGTPAQLLAYLRMTERDEKEMPALFKGQRIVCDFDNTLVTYPKVPGDYTTVEPVPHVIQLLRDMQAMGAEIVIHTSQRMKAHKHNVGAVVKDVGKITFDTLEKFDIPYDELIFGKPIGDIYIDDRAVNPFIHMYEEVGLPVPVADRKQEDSYVAVPPRAFHKLILEKDRVVKIGHGLEMEAQLEYYRNIPLELSHLFPKLLRSSISDGLNREVMIELERRNGIPLSFAYIHGLLSVAQLQEVIDSVREIHAGHVFHQTGYPIDDVYLNWAPKLQKRWVTRRKDVYDNFNNSDVVVPKMIAWLQKYRELNRALPADIIHGDCVWTNCILGCKKPRVAWVDMKGLVADKFAMYGDQNYDWCKFIQCLYGYDYILLNYDEEYEKSKQYREGFLEYFRQQYTSWFGPEAWAWLVLLASTFYIALLLQHTDTPRECQIFFRFGAELLDKAEELLAQFGHKVILQQ